MASDHVHLHVSVPPMLSISKLLQYIKGHTSHKLLKEYKHLSKRYWGATFVGERVFCINDRSGDGRGDSTVYCQARDSCGR